MGDYVSLCQAELSRVLFSSPVLLHSDIEEVCFFPKSHQATHTCTHVRQAGVRGRAPETWDWLAVISVLVETFGNYRVVRPLSDCVTTARWR